MDTGGNSKTAPAMAAMMATSGTVATATIVGAANNSGRRVAVVPTGVGSRYAATTSTADSSPPHRTTGRRQHNPVTARQTRRLTRACFAAKVWYPPLPNASPTAIVGTRALTASATPARRLPDKEKRPASYAEEHTSYRAGERC